MHKELKKELLTIGEVAKLCNISRKTLRYYDECGLITPDYIAKDTGYRYYSKTNVLRLPMIKYYKQMGFKLCEIKDILFSNSSYVQEHSFINKMDDLKKEMEYMHEQLTALSDWYNLIQEARMVLEMNVNEVSTKFITPCEYCYLDQDFSYDYPASVINIPWVNYLESNQCEITGEVILCFENLDDQMNKKSTRARVMQTLVHCENKSIPTIKTERKIVASIYHKGSHETLHQSYQKIVNWAKQNHYHYGPECVERFVIDYWTTTNPDEFVTELLVPIQKIT